MNVPSPATVITTWDISATTPAPELTVKPNGNGKRT